MIKLFEQYNEYNKVKDWLDMFGIENYTIHDDLTVDVDGDVDLSESSLDEIPIQFGKVLGVFDLDENILETLKGCPEYVGDSFWCRSNNLYTLEGGPKYVGGHFNCGFNNLTSLEYSPNEIRGDFSCAHNKITTFRNATKEVYGNVWYSDNPLPDEVLNLASPKLFIKYQDEYGIWNTDGSFNNGRWNIFIKDYKEGILT